MAALANICLLPSGGRADVMKHLICLKIIYSSEGSREKSGQGVELDRLQQAAEL
jgi:hypothetical protein